jgi:hypothetical protein
MNIMLHPNRRSVGLSETEIEQQLKSELARLLLEAKKWTMSEHPERDRWLVLRLILFLRLLIERNNRRGHDI